MPQTLRVELKGATEFAATAKKIAKQANIDVDQILAAGAIETQSAAQNPSCPICQKAKSTNADRSRTKHRPQATHQTAIPARSSKTSRSKRSRVAMTLEAARVRLGGYGWNSVHQRFPRVRGFSLPMKRPSNLLLIDLRGFNWPTHTQFY